MKRLLIAVLALLTFPAFAQGDYPNKPIRMIVGFAPGGGTDIMARIVAEKMSRTLGQQIVVDNRPGAIGSIAMRQIAKSSPDGYSLVQANTSTLAIAPSMVANIGAQNGTNNKMNRTCKHAIAVPPATSSNSSRRHEKR